MSFLDNISEITGNQYAAKGKTVNDDRSTIDTGSYVLNALVSGSIYGGASSNSVTALAGVQASGKSFIVLSTVKTFLDKHEDGSVVFFESEGAINRQMMVERGIDADRVFIVPVVTIQDFRTQALKVLGKYEEEKPRPPLMFVLDSLGMLSTNKELSDITDGKDTRDMTRAQMVRAAFRVLTLKLSMLGVPMFITNHTYDSVGGMFPEKVVSGGGGLLFASSTIIMLSKKKEKEGAEVVGNIIHCKTYKSRLSKENQMVDIRLYYDRGLDRYYGLLEIAEKHGVIEKMGTRYIMPDGSKQYASVIYKEPEKYFTKELLDKIDKVCKKEFLYGIQEEDEIEEQIEENEE
jgi:RecA/RadA recombinase